MPAGNRANEQRDEQAVASEVKDAAYGARSSQIPEKTGAQIEQAILTPSGQVASLAADGMPIKDAIDKAMGMILTTIPCAKSTTRDL